MTKEIGNHDMLYKSLVDTVAKEEIQPEEFTVRQFMRDTGVTETTARRILDEKARSGMLSTRIARMNGHSIRAYVVVQ